MHALSLSRAERQQASLQTRKFKILVQEEIKGAFSHIQNLQVSNQNLSTVPKRNTSIESTATHCLNTQLILC